MIPLRDTIESRRYPVINTAIIGINVLVYFIELSQGYGLNNFIIKYGLVPARYTVWEYSRYFSFKEQVFSFISFMFVHGGFWHLLGNMWSLYIFGDNVEDRLGHIRYLIFYILCGIASGITHLLLNFHSTVPTIGASGAIAGVMGAYFVLYPGSRILTLIPIFFIPYLIEIPAFVFLGIWFMFQFLSATLTHGIGTGVAWWAHVGGFLSGILLLKLLLKFELDIMPERIKSATVRKRTPRLHVLHSRIPSEELDIYGEIPITPHEAVFGTSKLINVPWGLKSRFFRVRIPPGIEDGTTLRLKGLGKTSPDGTKGDLYLRIRISS